MVIHKQSTARTVNVGPVLDSTGAIYTGMAIGDFSISKAGGTVTAMASAATATSTGNGLYQIAMTTANNDTLGSLDITCTKSTYAMTPYRATVLTASTYDAIVTNAANAAGGLCDVQRIAGDATSASILSQAMNNGYDTETDTFLSTLATSQGAIVFTSITGNITGNLSGSVNSVVDVSNISTGAAAGVWSYGTRYLTQDRVVTVPSIQQTHRQIVQGDSYSSTARAFLVLASGGGEWPTDLSTYTWTCTLTKDTSNTASGTSPITGTVSVVTATGSSRSLRVSISSTLTASMALGRYTYFVRGTKSSEAWVVEQGTVDVIDDV